MAKSLDIGTMFLVKGEVDEVVSQPLFTPERNGFIQVASGAETEATLKENGWSYVKHGKDYYVIGEDAIKLRNLLAIRSKPGEGQIVVSNVGEFRRPMKDGILNTAEEKLSTVIIQQIIKGLLGKPSHPGEVLCYCAPGDPVDNNLSVIFHKKMLTMFLESLGYKVECIPEALAIIYSERPVAEDSDEVGGEAPFSGIGISCGAGMVNIAFAWKKMPLINFSIARSGDWIDKMAAQSSGEDITAITRYKETSFNLADVDFGDLKQSSLYVFYHEMIKHALTNFAEKFNSFKNQYHTPLEIVVAGGTASIPGFIDAFKTVMEGLTLPFKVKEVRLAKDPLYTVANGCLVQAISMENKLKKEDKKK